MMRGEKTMKILEIMQRGATDAADIIAGFLSAGYGASYSGVQYEIYKHQNKRARTLALKKEQRKIKQKCHKLIYKLKQDGLISEKTRGNKKILYITKQGTNKLQLLTTAKNNALPEYHYEKVDSANFIVITFDIPEKERRKRSWIRSALNNLGLTMIQKSVWVGKSKIPKNFLKDLAAINLINFVEIFEVTKTGSLKHIL